MPQRDIVPPAGMRSGIAVVLAAAAAAFAPPVKLGVADWASSQRMVSPESGSPYPGPWSNDLAPYLVEIMNCLSPHDPCVEVTFMKPHQVGGSEVGINLFGHTVDQSPSSMAIVCATLDEARAFERIKLQPAIDATPALRDKVAEVKSRDEKGSSASFKRFPRGFCRLTGANTSTGLQMVSVRVLICEEISEWPEDAGGRGDPLTQAIKRQTAWSLKGKKRYLASTPGIQGLCRIEAKFEASDQRRYYVDCPHCGAAQTLAWPNLKWRQNHAPHGAYFVCAASDCGGVIEHHHKRAMVAGGRWIKTYPGDDAPGPVIAPEDLSKYLARPSRGRQPGFHIWQAYSPFVDWDEMVADHLEADGNPAKEKVFCQQVLGQPWEVSGEVPDWQVLYLRREPYELGYIPPGALVLTGMADVQGDRLEWGVYGWGIGMSAWLVDKGVIPGDPADLETWKKLAAVIEHQYADWQGNRWPIEAFGVDAGYMSNFVYNFCRSRARVFALDGRHGWTRPSIGIPSKQDVTWGGKTIKGGVLLWPTGTYSLKASIYSALRKTIEGPNMDGLWPMGCVHTPVDVKCDEEHFKQLCSEFLHGKLINGQLVRKWEQLQNQANEQLDILVGARALAAHLRLETLSAEGWRKIAEQRGAPPESAQLELDQFAARAPADDDGLVTKSSERSAARPGNWLGRRGSDWFGRG